MHALIAGPAVAVLCCSVQYGQSAAGSQERVLRFVHPQTARSAGEIATAIRVIAGLDVQLASGNAPENLTLRGSGEPAGLAEWLFAVLDQPANPQADLAPRDYRGANGRGDSPHLHVQRAKSRDHARYREQLAMAEWLFAQFGKFAKQPPARAVSPEYRMKDPQAEGVTKVYFAANAATVQDFQELATLMRTIADVRRVFTYNEPRAIVVRGTSAQMAIVEWLFQELDRSHPQIPQEYRPSGSHDDLPKVLYLVHTTTVPDFQKAATRIRTATNVTRCSLTTNRGRWYYAPLRAKAS
jgi:hypothetical protein